MASGNEANLKFSPMLLLLFFFVSLATGEEASVQVIIADEPQLEYCTFFNNRAPTDQPNLKNCTWFSGRSCCRQAEIAATFGNVKPLQGATVECQQMINYLMCYICAPNQNVFYKRERLTVCEQFCEKILAACAQALFKGATFLQLYNDNATEFCKSRRFEVVPAGRERADHCFNFDPEWDRHFKVSSGVDFTGGEKSWRLLIWCVAAIFSNTLIESSA